MEPAIKFEKNVGVRAKEAAELFAINRIALSNYFKNYKCKDVGKPTMVSMVGLARRRSPRFW